MCKLENMKSPLNPYKQASRESLRYQTRMRPTHRLRFKAGKITRSSSIQIHSISLPKRSRILPLFAAVDPLLRMNKHIKEENPSNKKNPKHV